MPAYAAKARDQGATRIAEASLIIADFYYIRLGRSTPQLLQLLPVQLYVHRYITCDGPYRWTISNVIKPTLLMVRSTKHYQG